MKALLVALVAFQQAAAPAFRTAIERVQLDVSVTRDGRPVPGLTADDFVVADNGTAQDIESVLLATMPLSVTLVFDVSASVSGSRLQHLIDAGQGLLRSLHDGDHAALITFSNAVWVRVGLTRDFARVSTAIGALHPDGATSARDAVQLALELPPAEDTRPLVLVFTDGADTLSWLTESEIVESARRTGVVIHVVQLENGAETPRLGQRLADASGGRAWSAASERDLQRLFTSALDDMRARYLLTFAPRRQSAPGWHELKVRLKNGRADIHARPGYYVSPANLNP